MQNEEINAQIQLYEQRIKRLKDRLENKLDLCIQELQQDKEFQKFSRFLEYKTEIPLNIKCLYKLNVSVPFQTILDLNYGDLVSTLIVENTVYNESHNFMIEKFGINSTNESSTYLQIDDLKNIDPQFAQAYQNLMDVKDTLLNIIKRIALSHEVDYIDILEKLDNWTYSDINRNKLK